MCWDGGRVIVTYEVTWDEQRHRQELIGLCARLEWEGGREGASV